jgi:diguanylate cyclase (GGDEF)-like protein
MELDPKTNHALGALCTGIGCAAVLLGCTVLLGGWGLGLDALKNVLPGMSTMKANTTIAVSVLGVSLALVQSRPPLRVLGWTAAGLALGLGLLTLAEYAFNWNAGLDELLFKDRDVSSEAAAGRPALATALMIALLGAALVCAHHRALRAAKSFAAITASLIAWAALNAYVFGPHALHEVPFFSSIALHTAAILLLLGIGVLATAPVSWPIRTVVARGTGGIICRWLLPFAIVAPPFLGWLLTRSAAQDAFPTEFDWALYSAASSLGSVWLIMMLAHRITLIDAERSAATELSRHDPLTGLANRRAFDAFLLESFRLARRHEHPLSLMLLDVDRFKSYNDEYGHPAGDELLKGLSALLASIGRGTDLVARVGGEEFAIVLPETDLEGAAILGERARAEVERSALFRRRMTVSVGIAAVTSRTASPATLVQECDAALYRAKRAGRNQVFGGSERVTAGRQDA